MGPQALSTFVIRWGISEGESGFLAFCLAKKLLHRPPEARALSQQALSTKIRALIWAIFKIA